MAKTLTFEQAKVARKETPWMYLVSFVSGENKIGSFVIASKTQLPLWHVFFMFQKSETEPQNLTITSVQEISKPD